MASVCHFSNLTAVLAFDDILTGDERSLREMLTTSNNMVDLKAIANKHKLTLEQLICALGFNPNIKKLNGLFPITGHKNADALVQARNEIYVNDVYKKLSLANILSFYSTIRHDASMLQVTQYLLRSRVKNIENRIEITVNSSIINKYKVEMKAIYADQIADIDFAEARLSNMESGFRALLSEACIITESRLIPIGDIFFRETILPEEKRKLLSKNLIPVELVKSRLADQNISRQEKKMLSDFLALNIDKPPIQK